MANESQVESPNSPAAPSTQLKWYRMQGADGKWYKTQAASPDLAKAKILKQPSIKGPTPIFTKSAAAPSTPATVKTEVGGLGRAKALGREAALGAFSGAGIAETMNPLIDTAKAVGGLFDEPKGIVENIIGPGLPLYRMVRGMAEGTYQAGGDIGGGIAKGLHGDPEGYEQAAHGAGQFAGTLATLGVFGSDDLTATKTIARLRETAGELDSRALKVAKGTSTATGLQVAQEGIWGKMKNLPDLIEKSRKAKYARIEQLAREADKNGVTIDMSKEIGPIVQEWKKIANQRANLSTSIIKKTSAFLAQLGVKFDPQTNMPSPRNLSSMSVSDAVDLTRHDGLLSKMSKFEKERPEQISNLARRIDQRFHDKIAEASPELGRLRAEQGRLIEARDTAVKNYENFLNEKATLAKSIFKMGTGSIGAYLGLKLLGVPYAEAFAVPLLLWNALRSTPVRTLKAAVYARAADMLEGTVKGNYIPPSRRVTKPPTGGPTVAPSGVGGPSGPTAPSAQIAAVSGVPKQLTGGVAAGPPNIPNQLALGPGAGIAEDAVEAARRRPDPPSVTTPPENMVPPEARASTIIRKEEREALAKKMESRGAAKAELEKKPPTTKIEGAIPARVRQNLIDEIDRQSAVLNNPTSGMAVTHAKNVLDQVRTLLNDKKLAGLSEAERKNLIDRSNWRERQRRAREKTAGVKPVEAGAASEGAETATGRLTSEPLSAGGSPEDLLLAKEEAYRQLAKMPHGQEFVKDLKLTARELEKGAKDKGVAYDPNSELDAVVEAIQLMREQRLEP